MGESSVLCSHICPPFWEEGGGTSGLVVKRHLGPWPENRALGACSTCLVCDGVSSTQTVVNCFV